LVEALDAFDEPHLLSLLTVKKSNGKSSRSLITGVALNLPYNLVQKRKTLTEVADYGTDTVDRLNSVFGGRSTQLGLSFVWLCAVGARRGRAAYRRRSVPNRQTLRGAEWRGGNDCDTRNHVATKAGESSREFYEETNRDPRTTRRTLQFRRRAHLVEQSAIDRCLWTTENDVALGITKEVCTHRRDAGPRSE
jgi:hypothetical protein